MSKQVPLAINDGIMVATELNGCMMLGRATVFEQNMANFPRVQTGMEAFEGSAFHVSRQAELRIRWMDRMFDRFIARSGAPAG